MAFNWKMYTYIRGYTNFRAQLYVMESVFQDGVLLCQCSKNYQRHSESSLKAKATDLPCILQMQGLILHTFPLRYLYILCCIVCIAPHAQQNLTHRHKYQHSREKNKTKSKDKQKIQMTDCGIFQEKKQSSGWYKISSSCYNYM